MSHAAWLWQVFEPELFDRLCDKTAARLKKLRSKLGFDAVAFMGMSGSLLAPPVARQLKLRMIAVRPVGNSSHTHSVHVVEAPDGCDRYVILDDFIETGETVRRIVRETKKELPYVRPVGILLHEAGDARGFTGDEYVVGGYKLPVHRL
jgi:orotate phosphoribosyltransferase